MKYTWVDKVAYSDLIDPDNHPRMSVFCRNGEWFVGCSLAPPQRYFYISEATDLASAKALAVETVRHAAYRNAREFDAIFPPEAV
jgi:ssDNA-binding Zn-finger/Zn-ribbon topoisomerase 1